jgi:glycine dehydrogenase subunit 1
MEKLESILSSHKVSSILYQYPNFLGQLENQEELINMAHKYGALSITINPEPLIFGICKPPGLLNSDIVVGEGVGFCPSTGLGSPSLGLFATKKKFLRFFPGRLVGITHDKKGKKCFVLTLQTREQHIRRDRATSNTDRKLYLNALACLITLSLYGKSGFYEISKQNIIKNIYFRKQIKLGNKVTVKYDNSNFNETVIEFKNRSDLKTFINTMKQKNMHVGVDLYNFFVNLNKHLLICITELNSIEDINTIIKELI